VQWNEPVSAIPDLNLLGLLRRLTEGEVNYVLVDPAGAEPYELLYQRSEVVEFDGFSIRIVSLDDLLAMKRAAGRLRDLADIEALEVARRQVSSDALEVLADASAPPTQTERHS
jgi:hypothetical protein